MKDSIVVITGANSGIGKAAAHKFAAEGYRVVMACRNLAISKPVQQEIMSISGNQTVDLLELDVSSFDSIRAFCAVFKATYSKLDILIHNAAYLSHGETEYRLSSEHVELSFATNAYGPLYMIELLVEWLARSDDARVLNACTTNIKNFFDPKRSIEFDNLRGEHRSTRRYSSYKMYGDSKMAFLILTIKMAEQWRERGIKVNAIQINRVKLSKETIAKMKSYWKALAWAQNLTNPHPSGMADNYYHICTSDVFQDATGQLINHKCEIVQPSVSEQGLDQLKNIFGSSHYPRYAIDHANVEKVWGMGQALIAAHSSRY
ncbi:SDR family NAD(P)-dependent oxidoreductase [Paenibacillus paeoniae]|uniref:SDR family NAD(P)-dependent oxidoreductase n=1 Tax=Paenibacillus paeoniae TaxID=2292705 RepID=A0A371PN86_9BACL|nr:SDR family NAD(P)-dependent oxidoreductase [Paenibacillus paeoniae]REK77593.1 SDR family NAD(P)-dependent oxidoreductase [Paenibacillus paeoniae]